MQYCGAPGLTRDAWSGLRLVDRRRNDGLAKFWRQNSVDHQEMGDLMGFNMIYIINNGDTLGYDIWIFVWILILISCIL